MKIPLFVRQYFTISCIVSSIFIIPTAYAASPTTPTNNTGVKAKVEAFFADIPAMLSIAKCESGFQQYRKNGTTFTGAQGRYVGVFQIAKSHTPSAKKLGFDIYTLDGNLGYARYMYQRQGLQPWKGCVKGKVTNHATTLKEVKK